MKKLEDVGVLVARILMPILFIVAGWGKITGYAGTQQYMEAMGVPGFLLPLTILLSSLVGAVVGIALILLRKHGREIPIPFGPYLAAAGLLALYWGKPLTEAYLGLL